MKDFSIFYRTSNVSKDFKNTLCAQYICISVSHSLEHLNVTSSAFPLFSSSSVKVERRTDGTIPTSISMFSWNRCEVCSWYSAHLELSLLLQHVVWGVLRANFPHASCRDLSFQIALPDSNTAPRVAEAPSKQLDLIAKSHSRESQVKFMIKALSVSPMWLSFRM